MDPTGLERPMPSDATQDRTRKEVLALFLLTMVLMPALAIGVVGGFGFGVWCWQMVAGPPGPPPRGK